MSGLGTINTDILFSLPGPVSPIFSLQDALSIWDPFAAQPDDSQAILYTNGCIQTDGTRNCTAACLDPTQAFRTLESLHNCLIYAGIADLYAHQALSSNDTKVADDFKIQRSDWNSSLSQSIKSTITGCFNDHCTSSSSCTAFASSVFWGSSEDGAFNIFGINGEAALLCRYIAQPVVLNSDIGGIGVYSSYCIQSALALLGTFLVLLWGWGVDYVYFSFMVGIGSIDGTEPANVLSETFRKRRLAHLTATLTDFQKAQCFFMLAVNIAAQASKTYGGLTPVSLQELYDNYSILAIVAISGSLPITTTLLALHMVDMTSSYLLGLSGYTIGFSITTITTISNFEPRLADLESIQAQASKGNKYPKCGDNDLTVYCLEYHDNDQRKTLVWGIMAYCLVVLVYISAYHHNAFRDPLTHQTRPWILYIPNTLTTFFAKLNNAEETAASQDWPRKFRHFLVIRLYFMIFLVCIVCFGFVSKGLASFHAKVDTNAWTFGQIVAITIWAQPLCEYLHLELLGMTRGFQHRLLPPYKVLAAVTPTAAQPVP